MPDLVIDASVALKWALDDEDAVEQAVALRDAAIDGRARLFAPTLWMYELANGLVSAVRRRRLGERVGAQALGHLRAIGVELVDPDPAETYREAMRHGLSAYDASYVALARALDAPLVTGDRPLLRAVSGLEVRWVGDDWA
jgi:predicted nucleic acid-binding protein